MEQLDHNKYHTRHWLRIYIQERKCACALWKKLSCDHYKKIVVWVEIGMHV